MTTHTVEEGECLASISRHYGFSRWQRIYYHENNRDLRTLRPNPNVLYPGDEIFIPEKELAYYPCQTERRHSFLLKGQLTHVRVLVEDPQGIPYANKRYLLRVGARTYEGRTNSEGLITEAVSASAVSGTLSVWLSEEADAEPEIWPVRIGHLDPDDTVSGVKARLANLGYLVEEPDDVITDATRDALLQFQADHGLDPTGEINDPTRKKLKEAHCET